jgi:head-tail adaptor
MDIKSGDLVHKVTIKRPVSSLNNEGGRQLTYETAFETFAAVRNPSMYRATDAAGTTLVGTKDFYIRYSAERSLIGKEWLINYETKDYIVHEVENIDQRKWYIKFKARNG